MLPSMDEIIAVLPSELLLLRDISHLNIEAATAELVLTIAGELKKADVVICLNGDGDDFTVIKGSKTLFDCCAKGINYDGNVICYKTKSYAQSHVLGAMISTNVNRLTHQGSIERIRHMLVNPPTVPDDDNDSALRIDPTKSVFDGTGRKKLN